MDAPRSPLSVIVVAVNGDDLLRRCLASLGGNGASAEVLVVSPRGRAGAVPRSEEGATRIRRHVAPDGATVPQLRTLGIAHSSGEIVAFLEDDCVAEEGWCTAVLDAFRGASSAVGGAIAPGAYAGALDWAMYFCEYGSFMPPVRRGPSRLLPGTNVAYRRSVLFSVLGRAQVTGGSGFYEAFAHRALMRSGYNLRLDPSLTVVNARRWRAREALASRFHHGRGFAALRAAGEPVGVRAARLALAIVVPVIQIARTTRSVITRPRFLAPYVRALPWVALCALSWSAGEFVGTLLGPGDSLGRWR